MKLTGDCYLVLEQKRYGFAELCVKSVRKEKPKLDAGQVAIKLQLSIDSTAFNAPVPTAKIDVPETAVVPALDVEIEEVPV